MAYGCDLLEKCTNSPSLDSSIPPYGADFLQNLELNRQLSREFDTLRHVFWIKVSNALLKVHVPWFLVF